jgi:hypothetical protein
MKKTMLTYKTLDRFEAECITENYTEAEIEAVEHAAYVANMNTCAHPEWTEADIFNDFMRVLSIHKITTTPKAIEEKENETMNEAIIETIKKEVEASTERSAWGKGVTAYALELVEGLEEAINSGYFDLDDLEAPKLLERALLNGASDWNQYSWGGCSLIYDEDIARRLCCPSELKKTRNGERRPNSREEWLDTQARALFQACNRVEKAVRAALAA